MGRNEIDGLEVPKNNANEALASEVDLYIGLFFDGTNNNKYQTMLGKMFRRKEILENARKRQSIKLPQSVSELLKMSRAEVEENYPNCFTKSELEFLYYGYGNINNPKSEAYNTFIEKKSALELKGLSQNNISSKPDDKDEREMLLGVAEAMEKKQEINEEKYNKYKGAPAQNVTYTNVAILESLYKCKDIKNGNDEVKERHISIYIEGSGSDMQIEASANTSHTVGHGVIGLGKGTGPSGAVAKVRKAVIMIERIMEQHRPSAEEGTRTVNLHFDICGFSRGATCARMFCYVLNPNPNNAEEAYKGDDSIVKNTKDLKLFTGKEKEFLQIITGSDGYKLSKKEIRNLLIADTVASIGVLYHQGIGGFVGNMFTRGTMNTVGGVGKGIEWVGNVGKTQVDIGTEDVDMWGKRPYHYQNVKDYGLWATKLAKNVIHICAIDEVRSNFALVDIESSIHNGGEKSIEVFIPGCHTDIGGGAAIGMDSVKLVRKNSKNHFTSYYVHDKKLLNDSKMVMPINVDKLKEMGWLDIHSIIIGPSGNTLTKCPEFENECHDETYCNNTNPDKILLYRHVSPGYSNVALSFLKEKAVDKPFFSIPTAYKVPKELKPLYNELNTINENGRYFVYPQCYEQYAELRRRYIHFSFNEQLRDVSDNRLVNGPEFVGLFKDRINVTSRIIYSGQCVSDEDSKQKHMFDYGSNNVKLRKFVFGQYFDCKMLEEWRDRPGSKLILDRDHDSGILRRNLVAFAGIDPENSAAHHLVGKGKETEEARNILKKYKININDPANGVFLPTSSTSSITGSLHYGSHSKKYLAEVARRFKRAKLLENVMRRKAVDEKELRQLYLDVLDSLRKDLISGKLLLN